MKPGDMAVLSLNGDHSRVQRLAGEQILLCKALALGVDGLVAQSLKHEPPCGR